MSSKTSFLFAKLSTSETRWANRQVEIVSALFDCVADIVAIIAVRQLPPKLSRRSFVKREFLYGTCFFAFCSHGIEIIKTNWAPRDEGASDKTENVSGCYCIDLDLYNPLKSLTETLYLKETQVYEKTEILTQTRSHIYKTK